MDPDRLIWAAVALAWFSAAVVTRRLRPTATLGLLVTLTWLAPAALGVGALWHRGPLIHLLLAAGAWWPRSRVAQVVVVGGYALSASPDGWPRAEVALVGATAIVAAAAAERSVRPVFPLRRGSWQAATGVTAIALVVPPLLAWSGVGAQWSATVLLGYGAGLVTVALLVVVTVRPWANPWVTDLAVDLGPGTTMDLWAELVPLVRDPQLVRAEVEEASRAAADLRTRLEGRQGELRGTMVESRASWQRLAESDEAARSALADRIDSLTAERLAHVITELEDVTGSATGGPALAAHRAGMHLVRAREELDALGQGLLAVALTDGLESALRRLATASTMHVDLDARHERLADLPVGTATTAYFVAAEAVTNAVKHARAHRIGITAQRSDGRLEVTVVDDGVGGASTDGAGLAGVRDRVLEAGGTLDVTSPPRGGTEVRAVLPVGGTDRQ